MSARVTYRQNRSGYIIESVIDGEWTPLAWTLNAPTPEEIDHLTDRNTRHE